MCWHRTGGQKLLSLAPILICSSWLISCGCKPQSLLWFNQCAAFREGELKEKWKQFTRGEEWKEIPALPVALRFVAVWPGPASHRLQMSWSDESLQEKSKRGDCFFPWWMGTRGSGALPCPRGCKPEWCLSGLPASCLWEGRRVYRWC